MESNGRSKVVRATFHDGRQARRAVADLERAGLDGDAVQLEGAHETAAVGRQSAGAESSSLAPLTGAGVGTSAMARGAVKGAIVGGLAGIVLLTPIVLVLLDVSIAARLLLGAVVGAVAGGTVGTLVQGSIQPVQEREDVPLGPGPITVSVTAADEESLHRGTEILRNHGAELVDAP